jgi:hypothetical protein
MAAAKWIRQDFTVNGTPAVPPARAPRGVTVLQTPDAPLFAALAAQWRSAGRIVPGQTDTEWAELVGRVPRLSGV